MCTDYHAGTGVEGDVTSPLLSVPCRSLSVGVVLPGTYSQGSLSSPRVRHSFANGTIGEKFIVKDKINVFITYELLFVCLFSCEFF